jgi:hypothetical protein
VNDPLKILFDENFGEPLVTALAEIIGSFHDEPCKVRHIFQVIPAGGKDDVWIPKIAKDGWIVISADRGKEGGSVKLPDICWRNKVTHFIASKSICNAKRFERLRVIITAWPTILIEARKPAGTRFSLRYDGHNRRVAVVECQPGTFSPTSAAAKKLTFDSRPKKQKRAIQRKRIAPEIPEAERLPFPKT